MKKTGLLITSLALFTTGSVAQTVTPSVDTTRNAVKEQMAELCNNIRQYNNQRAEAQEALIKGNFAISKADFAFADSIKQVIKSKEEALKNQGVANSRHLAHKEIKKADEKVIAADVSTVLAAKKTEKAAVKAGNTTAAMADEANVKAAKNILRKDIKQAKRDSRWHIAFVKYNHSSQA
jgi:hypothetical protein